LFQYLGISLVVAILLIPIVRWFWKRFDLPSKSALAIFAQREKDSEEAMLWTKIEVQVAAETKERREYEMKQREKQEMLGKSLTESEASEVWNSLGIDVPIQPVEREEAPPVIIRSTNQNEEPDWELIEKIRKIGQPVEGVPEAPDLELMIRQKQSETVVNSDWAADW
jgi:hypothetical protein